MSIHVCSQLFTNIWISTCPFWLNMQITDVSNHRNLSSAKSKGNDGDIIKFVVSSFDEFISLKLGNQPPKFGKLK